MKSFISLSLIALVGFVAAMPAENNARQEAAAISLPIPTNCAKITAEKPCFTAVTTVPPQVCPACVAPTDVVCPMIIKIETVTRPCAHPCCPTTTTATKTNPCPPCHRTCIVPTTTTTITQKCLTAMVEARATAPPS